MCLVDLTGKIFSVLPNFLTDGKLFPIVGKSYHMLGFSLPTNNFFFNNMTDMEIAFPLSEISRALPAVMKILSDELTVVGGVLVRFDIGNKGLLTMNGGAPIFWMAILVASANIPGYDVVIDQIFSVVKKYRGRAHWGKINRITPEVLRDGYGDKNVNEWLVVKNKYDPKYSFWNPTLAAWFGISK